MAETRVQRVYQLNGLIDARGSILEQVAGVLKVPVEAIKNFDEEAAINIVANTVNNHDNATGNSVFMYYPTFNPIDKIVQLYDER